jgi:hypothetical protein
MKPIPSCRYECPHCGNLHKTDEGAVDCCEHEIIEVEGFDCGECGEFYEDENDAKQCCKK